MGTRLLCGKQGLNYFLHKVFLVEDDGGKPRHKEAATKVRPVDLF